MKKIFALVLSILFLCSAVGCGQSAIDGKTPYIQDGYWHIDGVNTGVKAEGINGENGASGADGKTPYIQDGYWYIDGVNTQVRAEGIDGTNGTDGASGKTPYIQDGYWYIDGVNTQVKAEGVDGTNGTDGTDGKTPYIQDGYWYIDGVNTQVKAEGIDGTNGANGVGISKIEKTGTAGLVDTYEITYTDGNKTTFSITNGKDTADIHNNTYNITVNPSVSTSLIGTLTSTNDSTDRTAEIAAILASTGFCQLGPGEFYVTNLHMPANSTLCGTGYATKIILPDEVQEGYAIRLNNNCTVKDMRITSPTPISVSETVGNRHGIAYLGTYDSDKSSGGTFMSVSDVYIDNFTGGGITCNNTGYSPTASIGVSDVTIRNCNAGINISYWSEYHRFTNVHCNGCYYGCINNGGNNMFVNCSFSQNKVGFLIDNSNGDMPNNAHGSAIGCTFNHQDSNNGYAIEIHTTSNGFIFEGCQIFYGKTRLDNAKGIVFTGCNFGRSEGIEINGGGTNLFNSCVFGTAPQVTISNNEYTRFDNCYLRSGDALPEYTEPKD